MYRSLTSKLLLGIYSLALLISPLITRADTVKYLFDVEKGTKNIYTDIKPGEIIKGKMKITLLDDAQGTFSLGFRSALGNIGDPSSPLNMASWIKFPKGKDITIDGRTPEKKTAIIPFEITFPKTISPGDYVGLMTATLESVASLGGGTGVRMSSAIGVTMKFSVPGKRIHKLSLLSMVSEGFVPSTDKEKSAERKDLNIAFKYKAEGNSTLRPSAHITVKNTFGKTVYDQTKTFDDIAPGREMTRIVSIPDVDTIRGWLTVNSEITYSPVSIDGSVEKQAYKVGTGTLRVYTIPWTQVLLLLAIILIGVGVFAYRVLKMRKLIANSTSYTVKNGDTLQSVCGGINANPKDVIMVNKLSAPYFLTPGTTILIPQIK